MALKYLITGATGGLGKGVLRCLLESVPPSQIGAASSRVSNKASFEDLGIAFRHVDFNDPNTLDAGLRGVEHLLLVSSVGSNRIEQHGRVIDAAKRAGVKHLWYTSLAFGGLQNNSRSPVQAEHFETEKLLQKSGITYTSIREGIYAEAFSIFLDWQPDSTRILLPGDGEVAYTLRADLSEATARIMIRGGYDNQIILFTAQETITAREVIDIINETTDRQVQLEVVSRDEYIRLSPERDARGKSKEWFEMIAGIWDDITAGATSHVHPLMREILGREPTRPHDAIKMLLAENRNYTYL